MCATCGCGDETGVRIVDLAAGGAQHDHDHPHDHQHPHDHDHDHDHPHDHQHPHDHEHAPAEATRTVLLEQDVLAKNTTLAERNRGWLRGRDVLALNLMSSPGSGKTTLLERTIRELPDRGIAVIEGDQETTFDAERIKATGARVIQINTGAGCHLDADMVRRGLDALDPPAGTLVFIENVGNLVCPALFDLGEASRVVIMSVTEGIDKPLKYPHMFAGADLVVLNKIDLSPYVEFDPDQFSRQVAKVNPTAPIVPVSATRGDGLERWYSWIHDQH